MVRRAVRISALIAGLLLCIPLYYLQKGLTGRSQSPQLYLRWAARASGMRPKIIGRPLGGPVLYVANHLSWLDIILLAGATGTAFVAKKEIARWPVIGWMARLNHTIFVARTERRTIAGQANALRTALANGQKVALFPEGTTNGGEEILPFRPSLLAALFPPLPGLKIQPVAIDYGSCGSEIAWVGIEGAVANARRILSRPGTTPVVLHFLEPIDPAALADRKALADLARSAIVMALRKEPVPNEGPTAQR